MTSAVFENVLIESIIIDRDKRQRRELKDVKELADSISKVGLINPPVVNKEMELVAGERRLEACRMLGWTSIPVQYAEQMDEDDLYLIELEENVKRVDISWQEQNDAVSKYNEFCIKRTPGIAKEKIASQLNISESHFTRHLQVKRARDEKVSGVEEADKWSVAVGLVRRSIDRKRTAAFADVETIAEVARETAAPEISIPKTAEELVVPTKQKWELLCDSFLTWKPVQKYNFIHCDFPYGVGIGDSTGQSAAKLEGGYVDTPDVYFNLIKRLSENDFVDEQAHLMFWFSMDYYTETKALLEEAGWRVNPFPLIWHKSDNTGILPDKDRGPRRTYETAFLASRGDRKIVRAVANSFSGPSTREIHTSEKSLEMLKHFFRMLVDSSTVMLDPTAGSANALRAALTLGPTWITGIELSAEFHERALQRLIS